MPTTVASRADIKPEHRWNDTSVFTDPGAWENAFKELERELSSAEAFKGTLAESSARLTEWLEYDQTLAQKLAKLLVYAVMAYSVDTNDQEASSRYDRVRGLYAKAASETAFAEPEMLAIGFQKLREWTQIEPRLTVYQHYFERLDHRAAHLRSAEVEELLGALADPFGSATQIHGVLANTDLRFAPAKDSSGDTAEIAQGNIGTLLASPDRELRKTAWTNYADAHLSMKNTMAAALGTGIKQNVFVARARRYDSALEAALAPESIPRAVFYNLLETFKANLPTWHRYWRVRRKLLAVATLREYDLFAPLTEKTPEVPYEQAVTWLQDALKPLGSDYVETLRRGALEQRWVDRYPNKGKRMGAFSSGTQGTFPFIMMSYADDLFSMSTLTHELGHSMHSHLSWHSQPHVYSEYSIFVAEVASNFHQAMLRAYLFDADQDRDFQIALIEEAMSNFHRYFFVMPTLARFELELHERVARGEALSATSLNALMAELFAEGYGPELELDRERTGITWAEFHTHLYSRFYVYQYATGISGAHALARGILDGEPQAAENYLKFLSAGGSMYPLDALKLAGVDLSSLKPVAETFAVLAGLVDRLESLA